MNLNMLLTYIENMSKLAPVRKVSATLVASAITTILIWILSVLPPHVEVPSAVSAAITTVIGFVIGWLTPPSKE